MTYDVDQFDALIRNRRSVFPKDYTADRVPDAIIHKMLEHARWAPTHKRTEPWRFMVFTGDGLRQLGEQQAALYKEVTQADGSFKEERYQNLLTKPAQSSHIIMVGMKRDTNRSVPEVEELGAVFCAVQNMYLTATAYGFGCYLSTGGITYFEKAKELFGLEADDRIVGFLHVGVPRPEYAGTGKRQELDDKVIWVR